MGDPPVEDVLRAHRDQALQLLKENRGQTREGIELLARERLGAIAAAAQSGGPELTPEQLEALYQEVLNLSYIMFSLGFTVAHTVPAEPAGKR
ncbi:MAG TPA: hypothetical protein VGK74_23700 [Symbiobacteriaceae bacterium]